MDNKWLQFYQDVARMWLDVDVIQRDIEYQAKTFYAIDTNIILLYANPLRHRKYACSFRDENVNDEVVGDTAISLSEFFFGYGLVSPDDFLLYPSPLYDELIDVYYALLSEAKTEMAQTDSYQDKLDELEKQIELYKNNLTNQSEKEITKFLADSPGLVRLLSPFDYDSSSGAFYRLGVIGQTARVRNIEYHGLPIPEKSIVKNSTQYRVWNDALKAVIAKCNNPRSTYRIQSDVETLALIAIINDTLKADCNTGDLPSKLLYLTGDTAAHEAAATLPPMYGSDFLRHPRQYIPLLKLNYIQEISQSDKLEHISHYRELLKEVLQPLNRSELKFSEVVSNVANGNANDDINKLLLHCDQTAFTEENYEVLKAKRMTLASLSSVLNKRVLTIDALAAELTKKLLEDSKLIYQIQEKHQSIKGSFEKEISAINTLATAFHAYGNRMKLYLDNAMDDFHKLIDTEYRNEAMQHAANAAKSNITRGPVTLRRRDDKEDEKFFELIHQYVFDNNQTDLWKAIKSSSLYIRELIMALVAADANEWELAKKHCLRALKVAVVNRNNEALYFLAVATRHTCKDFNDYNNGIIKLEEFQKVWNDRYGITRVDFRYESEILSQYTAFFNYKIFIPDWDDRLVDKKPNLQATWKGLNSLKEKMSSLESGVMPNLVKERILRQIYSNKCCLYLMDRYITKEGQINSADGKIAYLQLLKLSSDPKFRSSYFINFLLAYHCWCFDESQKAWNQAMEQTRIALDHCTIPYEEFKYNKFIDELNASR